MKKTYKILAISDTHGKHEQMKKYVGELPQADIIVHAGDISSQGHRYEVEKFLEWFSGLTQYSHRIMIAGNHDFLFEEEPSIAESMIPENIIYLNDSGVTVDGIKFWGSPVSPRFFDWAFNRDRGDDIKKHWDLIPNDSDVVITHGPAEYILDYVIRSQEYVGCKDLALKLEEIEPMAHICGHIHCAYGKAYKHGTMFYNASILSEQYFVTNKPHLIEVSFDENDKPYIDIEDES